MVEWNESRYVGVANMTCARTYTYTYVSLVPRPHPLFNVTRSKGPGAPGRGIDRRPGTGMRRHARDARDRRDLIEP